DDVDARLRQAPGDRQADAFRTAGDQDRHDRSAPIANARCPRLGSPPWAGRARAAHCVLRLCMTIFRIPLAQPKGRSAKRVWPSAEANQRKRMRAVAYLKPSPITDEQALVDITLDRPSPSRRDLLVKIEAVSVNPVDVKRRGRDSPNGKP